MIREATFDDYETLMPEFKRVHELTPFKNIPIDEDHVRRMFVMAISMPNFFCMVSVDKNDKAKGLVAGLIDVNVFGVKVATDIIVAGDSGIPSLLKAFKDWSIGKGAEMFSITEISNNPRYRKLIEITGLNNAGGIYFMEVSGVSGFTFDDSAEDESEINDSTATSVGTGTATATTAAGLAVAFFGGYRSQSLGYLNDTTITNSFSIEVSGNPAVGNWNAIGAIAARDYSASGDYSATWDHGTNTGDQWGAIALFKDPAAGGAPTLSNATATSIGQTTATVGCTVTF